MTKNSFQKIFDIYYDLTNGRPQIDNCPDVFIELNSVSWFLKISIFIEGYSTDKDPDIIFTIDNETSDEFIYHVIEYLESCLEVKRIYLSNPLYDIKKENLKKYLKSVDI